MSLDFLARFPYEKPREIQKEALRTLQDNWENFDLFILQAPTAFGKTAVAKTLMTSMHSVSVITPTNLLVSQFLDEFPNTSSLSRLDSYYCEKWKRPCPSTRGKLLQFCRGCRCGTDLAIAKYRRGPGVYNYHTYLAHRLHRDVLVVDEAHNLIPIIRDRLALRIWQHDYKYPHNMWRPDQILTWIQELPENKKKHKKISALRESAMSENFPQYIIQRTEEWFSGKGTLRGQPELRDVLKLLPVDITEAPQMFNPREVKKIVLMSATIGPKDIELLGWGRGRRVCYIQCKHPIHPSRRPIIALNTVSVNRDYLSGDISKLVNEIRGIADYHRGEKGVIHATYQLAGLLAQSFDNDRTIYHDRSNKAEAYRQFREAPEDSGAILIACGMYEGIDLPEDAGRWQVIAKLPWPSLSSPAISHLAQKDPAGYVWECAKTVIQACGRICRSETDFGYTYILDSTFRRLYSEAEFLLPNWFKEAIVSENGR